MIAKDFDKWNEAKKQIDFATVVHIRYYHEREIWWCSLGVNIGCEHNGTGKEFQRPVLVIRGLSVQTCLIVPLTTSSNKHPLRVPIGKVNGKNAPAVLSQMRVIDVKRFIERIGYIQIDAFIEVMKTARGLL